MIGNRFRELGHSVLSTDILYNQDVFSYETSPIGDCSIVTNPPYDRTICQKFVEKCIDLSKQTVMLLPSDWDFAGSRCHLFSVGSEFQMKIACNKRVKWIENSKQTGMHNYAWYIWSQDWKGKEPLMRYAPQ